MNLKTDPTTGRILTRGKGAGEITSEEIRHRARELADIAGRSGAEITDEDLAQARKELSGLDLPATTVEDDTVVAGITRDPSEPPSITGRERQTLEGPDEEKAIERMALEGVEEAQHDQMLAARRRERRLDKDGSA
jgi:hypothetical protein